MTPQRTLNLESFLLFSTRFFFANITHDFLSAMNKQKDGAFGSINLSVQFNEDIFLRGKMIYEGENDTECSTSFGILFLSKGFLHTSVRVFMEML